MKILHLWFPLSTFLLPSWLAFCANGPVSPGAQNQIPTIDSCCVGPLHSSIGLHCQYPVGLSPWVAGALPKQSLLTREVQAVHLISSMEKTMSRLSVIHAAFVWRIACRGDVAVSPLEYTTATKDRPDEVTDTLRMQIVEISQTCTVLRAYRQELWELRQAIDDDARRAKHVQEDGVKDEALMAQESGNKNSLRQLRLLPDQLSKPLDDIEEKVEEYINEAEQVKMVLEYTVYLMDHTHQHSLYDTRAERSYFHTFPTAQVEHAPFDPEAKIISRAWLVLRLLTDPCGIPVISNCAFSDSEITI